MTSWWKKRPAADWLVRSETAGLALELTDAETDDVSAPQDLPPVLAVRKAYCQQLVEEGYAEQDGGLTRITWSELYSLLADDAHRTSVALLGLPPMADWVPRLQSSGTPSESGFRVSVSGWVPRSGTGASLLLERTGAVLTTPAGPALLHPSVWRLLQTLGQLAESGPTLTGEGRLRSAGQIREAAIACGAFLDDYLTRTRIVVPDRLGLGLVRTDVAGSPVVEVRPELTGAPDAWLNQFDRYSTVRARYDVTEPDGGMSHVVPGEGVHAVLEAIKEMPGRRVASDAARLFLHNPFAILGDDARGALDAGEFEAARSRAGIRFWHLSVAGEVPRGTPLKVDLVDPEGQVPDQHREVAAPAGAIELLASAQRARARGLPLFGWRGQDIEFGPDTETALSAVARWLEATTLSAIALTYPEVFDLSAYSDRVIGFEGRAVGVPYVARKDAGQGWLPENLEYGIALPVNSESAAVSIPIAPAQLPELAAAIEGARARGQTGVRLPGTDRDVPLEDAEGWLRAFRSHERSGDRPRSATSPRDPAPHGRVPILKIFHNVEQLDYGAAALLPEVPATAQLGRPAALRADVHLLPHQERGIAWLQHRFGQRGDGVTGCLLADDMGLGKTLQALCLMVWYRECQTPSRPCLIVAPLSLLENWKAEIARFLDGSQGPTVALYGDALTQLRLRPEEIDPELRALGLRRFLRPGFEERASIVLTTYETLRDYEFSLARVQWGVVVCDEAQKIKNPAALVTRAAKALRADFRIACTGTPVENTLADLWCLFDFFQPGLLASLSEFTRRFRRSIEAREAGHEGDVQLLRRAIDPWVLRRMKADVAALPPKYEADDPNADPACRRLPMSPLQQRLYAEAVRALREGFNGAERGPGSGAAILAILHQLRTICSNPLAVVSSGSEVAAVEEHLQHSPKLAWLLACLERVRARGEKAVVFTEFREMQRLLQRAIGHRFDVWPAIVNGATTVNPDSNGSRQQIIDRFQTAPGFGVIILSTTAVGFGVNIQAANHVIHFTRPWNPAREDQATDRCHRIGQTRSVHVYCPTVAGAGFESFDERVGELLARKRTLSSDMLAGVQEITLEDFNGL